MLNVQPPDSDRDTTAHADFLRLPAALRLRLVTSHDTLQLKQHIIIPSPSRLDPVQLVTRRGFAVILRLTAAVTPRAPGPGFGRIPGLVMHRAFGFLQM